MKTQAVLLAAAMSVCGPAFGGDQGSWQVAPVPFFFYMPETSLGGGVFAMASHTPAGGELKPQTFRAGALYTAKSQVVAAAEAEGYLFDDGLRLTAALSYARFPEVYFGVGPDADLREDSTPQDTRLALAAGWRIAPNLYAGPVYRLAWTRLLETEPGGELAASADPTRSSGAGALLTWDSRDTPAYPRAGQLATLEVTGYTPGLGSSGRWLAAKLDARSYHRLVGDHVLALQAVAWSTNGDVPLRELPRLGGDSLLRGYLDGRYRDEAMLAAQAEYRFPIIWRLGGVVFGGVAQVGPSLAEVSLSDPKVSGGAGLRFLLIEEQDVNLRLDFGMSPAGNGFYVQIMEAF